MDYVGVFMAGLIYHGFGIIVLLVIFLFWFERRVMAKVHTRIGPLYTGFQGLLQPVADLLKLLWKEKITPKRADKFLFNIVPFLLPVLAIFAFGFIPITESIVAIRTDFSLLFVLATLSMFPVLILTVSWASSNRYSLIGGLRATGLLIAYEIPLIISSAAIVAYAKTLDITGIVNAQQNIWFIIPQFLGAIVFFIAMLAELERVPFDIPTAEQEIVVGWETEFSGINFAYITLAKYSELIVFSMLYVDLYLGGWLGIFDPIVNFVIKWLIVVIVMVVVRAAYSRYRIDQLLNFGWKILIPLAFINIFVVKLVYLYVL